jgi:hypothetical protein
MEQTVSERRKTLGDFVGELKKRVVLERGFRDRLYRFLNMRNTFIHNFSAVSGSNLRSEKDRELATAFVIELTALSLFLIGVFMSLFTISAREEFGASYSQRTMLNRGK